MYDLAVDIYVMYDFILFLTFGQTLKKTILRVSENFVLEKQLITKSTKNYKIN